MVNDNLEQQIKLLYDYWFTQFDFPDENGNPYRSSSNPMTWNDVLKCDIPSKWKVVTIDSIVDLLSGFPFSSTSYSNSGKYKLLTIKNVQDNGIKTDVDNYIQTIPTNMPDYCLLKPKSLLMSLTGNVGRVGLMYVDNCLLNQRVALIKPKNEEIRTYIYALFKSDLIRKTMETIAGGSSQKNLSPIETGNLLIAYNEDIALKFSKTIDKYVDAIVSNLAENEELISLRDWLLPMLMNGQATINE